MYKTVVWKKIKKAKSLKLQASSKKDVDSHKIPDIK